MFIIVFFVAPRFGDRVLYLYCFCLHSFCNSIDIHQLDLPWLSSCDVFGMGGYFNCFLKVSNHEVEWNIEAPFFFEMGHLKKHLALGR